MSFDDRRKTGAAGLTRRTLDIIIALVLGGWGIVVMADSRRMGMGWSADGPAAGFFSFYIGAILAVASCAVIVRSAASRLPTRSAAGMIMTRTHASKALALLVPTALLVAVMPIAGLYAAAAAYLLWFAKQEAGFGWLTAVAFSLACALALFFVFTVAFDVPLPIGPVERWFGY